MAVECKALCVQIKGGSTAFVTECGNIFLRNGDILLVKPELVTLLLSRHKNLFSQPIDVTLEGKDRLKFGTYEVQRTTFNKVVETKQVKTIDKSKKRVDEIADNRSMTNEKARKKVRRRRNPRREVKDA